MRIAMLAAAALAFACAAQPEHAPVAETAPPPSACGMERFASLVGQPETAIPRASLPAGARVICATCMVTQDYRPDRLNIILSAEGRVASLRCG